MRFRPCIDIHNGKVKQIVGGSLKDEGDSARTNFASELDASFYARLYREDGLTGGHIILLNPPGSPYYDATKQQALHALGAWPGGMQVGGGITAENAAEYLEAGASAVIVTSFVFQEGAFRPERLEKLNESFRSGAVSMNSGRGTGLALINVHERIRMLQAGEAFGLHINSEVGVGTEVHVQLPIRIMPAEQEAGR